METSASHPNLSRLGREQRLALYGLAVGAALAAGASSAKANLITLDLTGQPVGNRTSPLGGSIYFDVNAATAATAVSFSSFAAADFRIDHPSLGVANGFGLAPGNGIAGFQLEGFKASNLQASHLVGPADNFNSQANIVPSGFTASGITGYIGLVFTISGGDTHYGWANLTSTIDGGVTLNALGYETNPDTPAHTEAPSAGVPDQGSSLALLAIGSVGLLAFRKNIRKTAPSEEVTAG